MRSSPPGGAGYTTVTSRFRAAGVLAAAIAGLLPGCAIETPAPLTGAMHFYIEAQEALAADDFAAAVAAARTLENLVGEEDVEVVVAAAASTDIEQLRQAFKPLSDAFARRDIPTGYDVAHCTMADDDRGARWIQKKGEIANPYFGASMPRCGAFGSDDEADEGY